MGNVIGMKCSCGYSAHIVIGSGMSRDYCKLPHFCKNCGVVNVDVMADEPQCPKCASSHVIRYGETQKTYQFTIMGVRLPKIRTAFWTHDKRASHPRASRPGDYACHSWGDWRISAGDHLCPGCSKMTLQLYPGPMLFFD